MKKLTPSFPILGRFCECEEDVEVTCDQDCENGGTCECGQCKCKDGFVGKCCQFKDCDQGKCIDEEKKFCGGIGDAACSGKTNGFSANNQKYFFRFDNFSKTINIRVIQERESVS